MWLAFSRRGSLSMRWFGVIIGLCAAALAGCASVYNEPVNRPLAASASGQPDLGIEGSPSADDIMIALSFSGGGTRAAAFSHGVLTEIDRTPVRGAGASSLLDRVDFVSGVSGG